MTGFVLLFALGVALGTVMVLATGAFTAVFWLIDRVTP